MSNKSDRPYLSDSDGAFVEDSVLRSLAVLPLAEWDEVLRTVAEVSFKVGRKQPAYANQRTMGRIHARALQMMGEDRGLPRSLLDKAVEALAPGLLGEERRLAENKQIATLSIRERAGIKKIAKAVGVPRSTAQDRLKQLGLRQSNERGVSRANKRIVEEVHGRLLLPERKF